VDPSPESGGGYGNLGRCHTAASESRCRGFVWLGFDNTASLSASISSQWRLRVKSLALSTQLLVPSCIQGNVRLVGMVHGPSFLR
jgi:hypothetical protein